MTFVLNRAREYCELDDKGKKQRKQEREVLTHWERSADGWMKLNIDGSYTAGSNQVSAGGILRKDEGEFVKGFSCRAYGTSAFHVELIGLLHGLRMAEELGVRKLEIEVDALEVYNIVSDPNLAAVRFRDEIAQCRGLLASSTWCAKLRATSRTSNQAADWLAKIGSNSNNNFSYFNSAPEDIVPILEVDSWMCETM